MAISDKIFRLKTPDSGSDSNYQNYEYMVAWYGSKGGFYTYLFTDWEQSKEVNTEVLNISDPDKIESLIKAEENTITVTAEDISRNDLIILFSVFKAKKVARLYKDGTYENIAVKSNSKIYKQTDGRYNVEIDFVEYEKPLPK